MAILNHRLAKILVFLGFLKQGWTGTNAMLPVRLAESDLLLLV
jgi:hypothetical protein